MQRAKVTSYVLLMILENFARTTNSFINKLAVKVVNLKPQQTAQTCTNLKVDSFIRVYRIMAITNDNGAFGK